MFLDGKLAIVTGGNSGIGSAIVEKLLELKAKVIVVDISESTFPKNNKNIFYFQADVSDFNLVGSLIEKLISKFSKIDILINNAGINKDAVVWKMDENQWDKVIDINLKGYFNFIRHLSPYFKKQQNGKIVNITSINGMRGKFGQSNYSAAKAGVIGLTKTIAKELGRYSINVNAVAPGLIETAMTQKLSKEARNKALAETALNRFGKREDVANLVAFLSSDLAMHVTGETIKVDGGQYI